MGDKIDAKIPVLFQKLKSYENEDTRFIKVKIWLMHLEENFNSSYFEKKVVEDAIPTLANTPILAYIEDNSDGEVDFSDHRMVLVKEDGQFKVKYVGQAIGVIPETNNAQFETRLCDDGIEREFLTVEGLVWQKWDDPIDIFNRDVVKAQSMELHDNYEGYWDKNDSLFHFTKFSFFGACALGEDVLPAMQNATIETQFSLDDFKHEVNSKMELFKSIFSTYSEKGGNEQVDEKLELLKKYSLTEETLKEKSINIEDYSVEELEEKIKEFQGNEPTDFSLTNEQFREELVRVLSVELIEDDWGWDYSRYSYVDYDESQVYAFDRSDNYKLYGFTYSVNDDSIQIDFSTKTRKKFTIVDFEGEVQTEMSQISSQHMEYEVKVAEKRIEDKFVDELNNSKDKFSKIENELSELRNFKSSKVKEEREIAENELFERFSSDLSEDDIKEIKESSSNFTLDQLEEKLYVLIGKKKVSFSKQVKKEKQTTVKVEIPSTNEEDAKLYGGLFEKYSNKSN